MNDVAVSRLSGGQSAADAACCLPQMRLLYLKPVQTGYPEDSDARLVVRCSPHCCSETVRFSLWHASHAPIPWDDDELLCGNMTQLWPLSRERWSGRSSSADPTPRL